jgi:hypothetical protein
MSIGAVAVHVVISEPDIGEKMREECLIYCCYKIIYYACLKSNSIIMNEYSIQQLAVNQSIVGAAAILNVHHGRRTCHSA